MTLPKQWIKFSSQVEVDSQIDLDSPIDDKHPDVPKRTLLAEAVFYELLYQIDMFRIAANIARPGSFRCAEGLVVIDGHFKRHARKFVHSIDDIWSLLERQAWPKLEALNFSEAWNWAVKQQGHHSGVGITRVSRALNAFSYLFGDEFASFGDADLL